MPQSQFPGKAALLQRVLPVYRAPFFNALGGACQKGLSVFAGLPRPQEMIKTTQKLEMARFHQGCNWHLLKGRFYVCIQFGLIHWLAEWDPDALIVEANPRYLRTPAAIRWMRQRKRPVIGWGLGAPPLSGTLASLRQQQRQKFIQQFDALITYSQTGAAEYSQLGFPEDHIFIAVNAVTPPPAHPQPQRSDSFANGPGRVLFVGRLQERKRVDNLLLACANLPEELQPEVIIVGDGPARSSLESLAKEIYPQAVFMGVRYHQALEEQFIHADLFVLPGTGGLAIQQAMSYGLPIIAAEADGTQTDLVRPGNGWQVPPDDPKQLQHILQEALQSPARLRKMGAESYRIVSEEINLKQMVRVFIKALNSCC